MVGGLVVRSSDLNTRPGRLSDDCGSAVEVHVVWIDASVSY
jgi:hypothetical protein